MWANCGVHKDMVFLPVSLRTLLMIIVKHSSNPNLCFHSSFAIMIFNLSQLIFIASNGQALLTFKRAQENLSRALLWILNTSSIPQYLTVFGLFVAGFGGVFYDIPAKLIICIFLNGKKVL